jgi:hypothetical protein
MQSITLKSHIGSDGLLKVHLPDMRDTDIEVVIVYQTTLVTHNTGEFGRIEGLHVEDWEIEA